MAEDPRHARTPIATVTDGLLLARRLDHMVRPGSSVTKIVGPKKLAYRTGLLLDD